MYGYQSQGDRCAKCTSLNQCDNNNGNNNGNGNNTNADKLDHAPANTHEDAVQTRYVWPSAGGRDGRVSSVYNQRE